MDLTIENAQIASDAAIALSKLSNGDKIVLNDGSVNLAANLNAGGYKITNLGDGTADGDACTYGQLQAVAAEGKAWKEVILYGGQLVDGASGGILAANVVVLNANLQTGDTITLNDGSSSENYVADTDFSVGVDIDATLANLQTAINAGAIAVSAVVSTLESIDDTNNVMIVYQDTIGEPTRIYGNAGAAARVEILPTTALYDGDAGDLVALPSSDPAATNFGFSRAYANLVSNETHYCRECDGSWSWDEDDEVWNLTGAASIPFASTTVHGKVKIHDGITVTDGVIGVDLTANDGLALSGSSPNKTISVDYDDSTIGIVSNQLAIKAGGVTGTQLNSSVAGNGLTGGGGSALSVVVDDSSIEISGDTLQVKASGVTNAMLAGSIADSKLSTITTANKVSGSAVQLAATTAIEDSTGLRLKDATAGAGLGITDQVMEVNVDDSSIEISTDTLQVKALGITNAMLAGSIADSKLSTITTANKVSGSAVQIASGAALADNTGLEVSVDDSSIEVSGAALQVKADGIKDTHLDFGTGAGQISAVDLPIADASAKFTATEVESALEELYDTQAAKYVFKTINC